MPRRENPHAGDAGHIKSRFDVVTNSFVTLYDAAEQGLDVAPDKYAVLCQRHSTLVGVNSKRAAESFLTFPEFCEECVQLHEAFDALRSRILTEETAAA